MMLLGFKARAAGEETVQPLANLSRDAHPEALKLLIREQENAPSPSRPATQADAQIAKLRLQAQKLGR